MQSPLKGSTREGEKECKAERKTLPRKLSWRTLTYTEADQVNIKEHVQDNKLCHKIGLKKKDFLEKVRQIVLWSSWLWNA